MSITQFITSPSYFVQLNKIGQYANGELNDTVKLKEAILNLVARNIFMKCVVRSTDSLDQCTLNSDKEVYNLFHK